MADDDARMQRYSWGPLIAGLAALVLLAVSLGIPIFLRTRNYDAERHAVHSLKTIVSAEADFRANDRDGNKVNDFWTGDVAGLYHERSARDGQPLRLIETGIAAADAFPLYPSAPPPDPQEGYLFQALDRDDSVPGDPDAVYRMDTDGSGRKVHHRGKFGFNAHPSAPSGGRYIYFVNENNTIFYFNNDKPLLNWPTDQELKQRIAGHE